MRKVAWILATGMLLFLGVTGLLDVPDEFRGAHTPFQWTVPIGVALYGVLGVAAGIGLALRKRWSVALTLAWGVTIVYVGTVASFAFSEPDVSPGMKATAAIPAAIATTVVAALVLWAARRAVAQQPSSKQRDHSAAGETP